jgi:hypothetical protein
MLRAILQKTVLFIFYKKNDFVKVPVLHNIASFIARLKACENW